MENPTRWGSFCQRWQRLEEGAWLSRVRVALFVIAGLALGIWGFMAWAANPVMFDDSFISFRYAYNLAHGEGIVYNVGERIEGYTNFLWVLITAAGLTLDTDAYLTARNVGVASYVLTILASVGIIAAVSERTWRGLLVVPLAAMLILPDGIAQMPGTGLETSAVGFCVVLVGITSFLWRPKRRWAAWLCQLVPLILCLLRPDMVPVYGAALGARLVDEKLRGAGWRQSLKATAVWFAPSAIGLVLYHVWRLVYYGSLLPNTYWAKHGHVTTYEPGIAYLRAFVQSDPQVALLVPFVVAAVLLFRDPRWRGFAIYGGLASGVYAAYVLKVGGDFMHYRFMFHIYPLFVVTAGIGILALVRRSWFAGVVCMATGLLLCRFDVVLEHHFGMQSIDNMDNYAQIGQKVGKRLREALPPDTIISTTLAGTISYYSRLTTIDQWGLTDSQVAAQTKVGKPTRGHEKAATIQYMRDRHVSFYLHHPKICSCKKPCYDDKMVREYPERDPDEPGRAPSVFLRIRDDECVRMWYLTQTDALTEYMCSHPDDFIVGKLRCPSRL